MPENEELPEFHFPQGYKGWFVVFVASLVGMLAGGGAIMLLGRLLDHA